MAIRSQITKIDSFPFQPSLHDLVLEKLSEISWLEDYLADPTDTVEQDFGLCRLVFICRLSCYLSHYLTLPHNPILHPPTRTAEAPAHTFATTEQLSKYTRRFWFLLNCRNHQFRGSYRCQLCVLISRTSKMFQRIQHAAVNPIHGLDTGKSGHCSVVSRGCPSAWACPPSCRPGQV